MPKKYKSKKYPGLNKNLFSKIKQEYFDIDYTDKLDTKELKEFMSKFNEEYLGANLNGNGKRLHKTKKLRKDCFDMNNARNRDVYSVSRATGRLFEHEPWMDEESYNPEDEIIEKIDKEKLK